MNGRETYNFSTVNCSQPLNNDTWNCSEHQETEDFKAKALTAMNAIAYTIIVLLCVGACAWLWLVRFVNKHRRDLRRSKDDDSFVHNSFSQDSRNGAETFEDGQIPMILPMIGMARNVQLEQNQADFNQVKMSDLKDDSTNSVEQKETKSD